MARRKRELVTRRRLSPELVEVLRLDWSARAVRASYANLLLGGWRRENIERIASAAVERGREEDVAGDRRSHVSSEYAPATSEHVQDDPPPNFSESHPEQPPRKG